MIIDFVYFESLLTRGILIHKRYDIQDIILFSSVETFLLVSSFLFHFCFNDHIRKNFLFVNYTGLNPLRFRESPSGSVTPRWPARI